MWESSYYIIAEVMGYKDSTGYREITLSGCLPPPIRAEMAVSLRVIKVTTFLK